MRTTFFPSRRAEDEGDHDDDAVGFGPRCPACLRTTEPWAAGRAVAWQCPGCGLTLLG